MKYFKEIMVVLIIILAFTCGMNAGQATMKPHIEFWQDSVEFWQESSDFWYEATQFWKIRAK